MKKIIAFSLWGDNPKYTIGAIKNANLTNEIYSGWTSRFYCGQSTPEEIINQLKNIDNCEVAMMNEDGNWTGMFWRFLPAGESDVDVMLSRDCDSRLNLREKAAVDEFMKSYKTFHIMRDHPWHTTEILGGMWGVKYPTLRKMKGMIDEYIKGDFWQVDQNFLRTKIYPLVVKDSLVHDEFFRYNTNARPFPIKREGQQFVGEAFDENDVPNFQHRSMIKIM
jgi:hypothetical protein